MQVARLIEQLDVTTTMYEKYMDKYQAGWSVEELNIAQQISEKLQIFSWHLNRYDNIRQTTTINDSEEKIYQEYFSQIDNYSFFLMKKLDACLHQLSVDEKII
jgi:KaiC/GvpD/RAD55 family RecA-like ATPase